MADPRFYDNRGPFPLGELCSGAGVNCPPEADPAASVFDVAGLAQAGPPHLTFYDGRLGRDEFAATKAGWCLIGKRVPDIAPAKTMLLPCGQVSRVFAAIARRFYPEHENGITSQEMAIHPSARLGKGVIIAPGVVIGAMVEIGDGVQIGPCASIGRGVTIGRNCQIGANATIAFAHLGDDVLIQAGVRIGGSGFGFASAADGHVKIPQVGRVIVQDRTEIGANSTIDRGTLGDTVIGEGTKIDNLVQIGHNSATGRHCVIAGQSGISGSSQLGDFVIVGGMAGIAGHLTVGDGVRLAGLSGVTRDLEAGRDYGGIPARPIREWHRETALIAKLARRGKRSTDE